MSPSKKDYIEFADPEVLRVLLANGVGDGIGITYADAAAVTSIGTWFRNNTEITSFDEFEYFGITSIPAYGFQGCTNLVSITLPSSVTFIGSDAFSGCSALTGTLTILSSVTSIGARAFQNCMFNNIYNYSRRAYNANIYAYRTENFGAGGGTFYLAGSINGGGYSGGYNWLFANIIVDGNWAASGNHQIVKLSSGTGVKQIRIGGDVSDSGYANDSIATGTGGTLEFLEVMGTKTGTGNAKFVTNDAGYYNGAIIHLGYNGIATTPAVCSASSSRIAHIYVGDGSSAAHDDAILAQYLADADWAQYSAKLDTWYNYVQSGGEYSTPPTIPTE